MANRELPKTLAQLGWCCPYAFIKHMEIRRAYSLNPATVRMMSANSLAQQTGLCERTIYNLRARLKSGELKCEGKEQGCMDPAKLRAKD